MTDAVIELSDVIVRQGSFCLDIPRWTAGRGEVIGLVGANGAGKSTLLRLLPGIDPPDQGRVRVFGHEPFADPVPVRLRLGWMTDDMGVPPMRIDRLLRWMSGFWPTWDARLVDELVERFQINLLAKTSALSKGEGTRLRLLLALAFRPEVLVLDEPATGLDVLGRRALLRSVLDVVQDAGRTVILSSHDLVDVERIADRIVLVEAGKIVLDAPTVDLVPAGRTLEQVLLARLGLT